MRTITGIAFILIILSCNSNSDTKNTTVTEDTSKGNTLSKDSLAEKGVKEVTSGSAGIIGMWRPDAEENVAFEIKKDTFFYPDQASTYK